MKLTSRSSSTALVAVIGLLLASAITPATAEASAPVRTATSPSLQDESLALAGQIEEAQELSERTGGPMIVGFTPVTVSTETASGVLEASFPLPEGCTPASEPLRIECETGDLTLEPVIMDLKGNLTAHRAEVLDSEILISAIAEAPMPGRYLFTIYAAAIGDEASLEVAVGALSWALSGETRSFVEDLTSNAAGADAPHLSKADAVLRPSAEVQAHAAAARPYISVPSNYVYCKTHTTAKCKPATLHDYCSYSPDTFLKASFRGPCARHDMAIDSIRKKDISLAAKKAQRTEADVLFSLRLVINCKYAYPADDLPSISCAVAAASYKAAVSLATANWNGK